MIELTEFEAWFITGCQHLYGEATIKNVAEHSQAMAHLKDEIYSPILANQEVYEKLFAEYLRLHDYFGRGGNNVMKSLKKIKAEVKHAAG
jgi:L-ribulokinase